jgi:histidinol dehydrogenase
LVGIDGFAGSWDVAIIAGVIADADMVVIDLAGQAECEHMSPAWLFTVRADLTDKVMRAVPKLIEVLAPVARTAAVVTGQIIGVDGQ